MLPWGLAALLRIHWRFWSDTMRPGGSMPAGGAMVMVAGVAGGGTGGGAGGAARLDGTVSTVTTPAEPTGEDEAAVEADGGGGCAM